jgi:transposase InsO family protein
VRIRKVRDDDIDQFIQRRDDPNKTKIPPEEEFKEVFEGLGLFHRQYSIKLKPGAIPVQMPVRKVPIAKRASLKKALKEMEEMGIIRKIEHETPWSSALILEDKPDGTVRPCLDPTGINKVLETEKFPIPTIEDIIVEIGDARYFSVVDITKGFWQIRLDKESADICTFVTPYGRYQFLRLPFGLASAAEIFRKYLDAIISGIKGVIAYMDDILIYAKTIEEHDKIMKEVLQKLLEAGVRLNYKKSVLRQEKVKFIGYIISQGSVQMDPARVEAINQFKPPTDKKQLMSYLGCLTYLARFTNELVEPMKTLRELLPKEVEYVWQSKHASAFEETKRLVSNLPTLTTYDSELELELSVDASNLGLGAMLTQNGKPLGFGSRTLTETEQRYSAIEKEMLAVCFGCEKFYVYLYGQNFKVKSDHKPLQSLWGKPLHLVPLRLQKMMLRIMPYQFKIEYIPGKDNYLPDTLSRAPVPITQEEREREHELDAMIVRHIREIPAASEFMERMRSETRRSTEMELLARRVIKGWPTKKHDTDKRIQQYWQQREDITVIDNLLLFRDRLIIPESMRRETMQSLHEGHITNERMQQRANETVYWPGMRKDIQSVAENCQKCAEGARKNPRLPLIQSAEVEFPLQRIGLDIAQTESEYWLIITDEYSGFITPVKIKTESSSEVIAEIKKWMTMCGIPQKITTDNGACFASKAFRDFAKRMQIEVQYSAPNHHQGNGLAESGVKRFKKLYDKKKDNIVEATIAENNTAKGRRPSPASLFYNREVRNGKIQKSSKLRDGRQEVHREWMEIRKEERKRTERTYNRGTREMKPIETNRGAMAYNHIKNQWVKVWVKERTSERNYIVILPSGHTTIRNRQDLRQSKQNVQLDPPVEEMPRGWSSPSWNQNQQEEEPEQQQPANQIGEQRESPPRRSTRRNAGRPPARYGKWNFDGK